MARGAGRACQEGAARGHSEMEKEPLGRLSLRKHQYLGYRQVPEGKKTSDGNRIPPLRKKDGTSTEGRAEQAEELLSTFFPPLPNVIEEESPRPQRAPLLMPPLTIEEVKDKVFAAKSWKAPGDDGLPAEVWKQTWPAVKDRVLSLFQTSLDSGCLPS